MPVEIRTHLLFDKVVYTHPGDTLVQADLRGVDLTNALLAGLDLRGANLAAATMAGAACAGAKLAGASLRGVCGFGAGMCGADLTGANLAGANFERADFSRACLAGASVDNACLDFAKFDAAELRGTTTRGTTFRHASFAGATISFNSHSMLSEILRRAAGKDVEKLKVVGYVLVRRDWCWNDFLTSGDPLVDWAVDVLAGCFKARSMLPSSLVLYLRDREFRDNGPHPLLTPHIPE